MITDQEGRRIAKEYEMLYLGATPDLLTGTRMTHVFSQEKLYACYWIEHSFDFASSVQACLASKRDWHAVLLKYT